VLNQGADGGQSVGHLMYMSLVGVEWRGLPG
jgi:hypothetical protein